MNVMLLAAGRSTRLGALGAALPKPLVPICGYPAITYGVTAAVRAGFPRLIANLFHHGPLIRETLGDGQTWGARIDYSPETDLLGTGGGIKHARPLFEPGPVLVMNAKVVAHLDLLPLLAAHEKARRERNVLATLLVRRDADAQRWGAITVTDAGDVVGILDARAPARTSLEEHAHESAVETMFTGIHIVEPELLDRLPNGVCDIVRDGYMPALRAGASFAAVMLDGYFAEHSTPERYWEGNRALLRDPALVLHPPGDLSGVSVDAEVHPSARIVGPVRIAAGAVVEANAVVGPESVVCTGARVAKHAQLTGTIVWPGAVANGVITKAVVTREGVVGIP